MWKVLVALVALVVLLPMTLACTVEQVRVVPSPSMVTDSPVARPSPSSSLPPTPAPPVDPARFAEVPSSGHEGFPLGRLSGEVVFAILSLVRAEEASVQLWAIPAQGEPKLAARFRGAARDIAGAFSPDGRRLVLSIATRRGAGGQRSSLVVLDLASGAITPLGRDDGDSDRDPVWSPAGSEIAYVRHPDQLRVGFDDGIWVMRDDGTGVRQVVLPRAGASTELYGWTANGSHIGFSHSDARNYTLIDPNSGAQLRVGSGYVAPADRSSFAWRGRAPRFAGVFVEQTGCVPRYLGVSDARGDFAIVVREGNVACAASLRNVRWHPSEDALLYITDGVGNLLHETALSGASRTISVARRPGLAEWSASGEQLVYAGLPGGECCNADDVRIVSRDGTGERVILASSTRVGIFALAVRSYP